MREQIRIACVAVPATVALIVIGKVIIMPALRGLRLLLGGG